MFSEPYDEGHVASDVPTSCDFLGVVQCVTVVLRVVVPSKGECVVCCGVTLATWRRCAEIQTGLGREYRRKETAEKTNA